MEKHGIGMSGLSVTWGVITQCLKWAGVIDWSWVAIWLPALILCTLAFILALCVLASE